MMNLRASSRHWHSQPAYLPKDELHFASHSEEEPDEPHASLSPPVHSSASSNQYESTTENRPKTASRTTPFIVECFFVFFPKRKRQPRYNEGGLNCSKPLCATHVKSLKLFLNAVHGTSQVCFLANTCVVI